MDTQHIYNPKNYYEITNEPNICKVRTSGYIPDILVPARIKEFDGKPIQAFKKAEIKLGKGRYAPKVRCVVELLIPARAIRFQPKNKKCRASSAHVVAIYAVALGNRHGKNSLGEKTKRRIAFSCHDKNFKYVVGQKVKPTKKFDKNHRSECSTGIHFFLTAKEAANY